MQTHTYSEFHSNRFSWYITCHQLESRFKRYFGVICCQHDHVQGSTIKPLVGLLKVKRKNMEKSVNAQLFERVRTFGVNETHCKGLTQVLDHYLAGVEATCGIHGHHWLRDKYEAFMKQYSKYSHTQVRAN